MKRSNSFGDAKQRLEQIVGSSESLRWELPEFPDGSVPLMATSKSTQKLGAD